ncbi:MAG: deoxyribose-phosphate aldolase [Pirellulaceae bacterium]|jgi:deoxyribose-phosphate aldolase|nr:deoxyribose-phosphate aldolase [Pirellulaceae bacterium]
MNAQYLEYAKMIDHSLLIPTMDERQLEDGCQLALAYDVASVCIMPYYLKRCAKILAGSSVQPSTTIGFPHGGHATAAKRFEAEQAIADGCQELDMVVNISQVLSGQWAYVTRDIAAVIEVAHAAKRRVKVIFENSYLQDEHKIRLCQLCSDLKADWVKTSTGYGGGGATIEDLKLMIAKVAPGVQVKAAGGVRDWATLKQVRALGVTRCGASRTQEILDAGRIEMGIEPIRFTPSASTAAGY